LAADTDDLSQQISAVYKTSFLRFMAAQVAGRALSISEFGIFEPLNDAVVFSEKMTDIEIISPLSPEFKKLR